ncbi:hypothetical protein DOY81_002582 [Sarcophaga bullata]|nr:hypothetical protein DOY81_002582 [Sarcophaga bullata]
MFKQTVWCGNNSGCVVDVSFFSVFQCFLYKREKIQNNNDEEKCEKRKIKQDKKK